MPWYNVPCLKRYSKGEIQIYTVLIAEDEMLVRMGIASSVPWPEYGMRVIGEAADGFSAWELYQKYRPDLVITDIRMPKMDGLELIRRIHADNPACRIIVVTNVEYGEAWEEAKKLDVSAFLVKADLNINDLEKAVLQARGNPSGVSNAEGGKEDNSGLLAQYIQNQIGSYPDYCALCREKGIAPLAPHRFILMHIRPDQKISHHLRKSLIQLVQHRFTDQQHLQLIMLESNALFVFTRDTDMQSNVHSLLQNMHRYIRDNFGAQARFVVLSDRASAEDLPALVQKALKYLACDEYFSSGLLPISADGIPYEADFIQAASTVKSCLFSGPADSQELSDAIDQIEQLPQAVSAGWDALSDALCAILHTLTGAEPSGLRDLKDGVDRLQQAADALLEEKTRQRRPELTDAIVYIQHHLNEDLSLPRICDIIGFHPAYFSSLFKKEIGIGYNAYITGIRIWEAKKLLRSTALPLNDICEKCGFSDVSWFSHRFKNATGMSPGQWRNAQ